jgi:hypothetical protein
MGPLHRRELRGVLCEFDVLGRVLWCGLDQHYPLHIAPALRLALKEMLGEFKSHFLLKSLTLYPERRVTLKLVDILKL